MVETLDILCVADMCVDLVVAGNVRPQFHQAEQLVDDYSIELGGSANIFVSQFVKLGGRAGVVGWVGQDVFGQFVLEKLHAVGVDTSRVRQHPQLKTGLGIALAEPDDRAILTYPGTIDAVEPFELTGELLPCQHWHIASYFLLNKLRKRWIGWLEQCRERKLTISLDTNWDPENRWEGVMNLLPLIDVFLPNEAEALAISGESDVTRAGEKLSRVGTLVVIKRGREGALAFKKNQCWRLQPDDSEGKAIHIVDSIGAGDNFDAGFIRAWLLGQEVEECLKLACRCAVASLAAAGGVQGQLHENVI
jgi:sugar/nucleoside kinase (ribokinase family)